MEIWSRDPGHSHLGVILWSTRSRGPTSMPMPNLKQVTQFIQKLWGGPKISKLGHMTLSHAPFEPWTLNLCRNPSTHTYCQILFFYLDPLLSYGWKQCELAILTVKLAMRMRGVTWPGRRRSSGITFGISDPSLPIHYITFIGLQRRLRLNRRCSPINVKGSLHGSTPIVKRYSVENVSSPVKIGPKNGSFQGITGCKCYTFVF